MTRLAGKIAHMTGAARGIGAAIAAAFVREGAQVILSDIDGAGVAAAAQALGPMMMAVTLDIREEAA